MAAIPCLWHGVQYPSVAVVAQTYGLTISRVRKVLDDCPSQSCRWLGLKNQIPYGRSTFQGMRPTSWGALVCVPTGEFYTFVTIDPEKIVKSLDKSASILGKNLRMRDLFRQYPNWELYWRLDWLHLPSKEKAMAQKSLRLQDPLCMNKASKYKRYTG